jgi:hypothetical protein
MDLFSKVVHDQHFPLRSSFQHADLPAMTVTIDFFRTLTIAPGARARIQLRGDLPWRPATADPHGWLVAKRVDPAATRFRRDCEFEPNKRVDGMDFEPRFTARSQLSCFSDSPAAKIGVNY